MGKNGVMHWKFNPVMSKKSNDPLQLAMIFLVGGGGLGSA